MIKSISTLIFLFLSLNSYAGPSVTGGVAEFHLLLDCRSAQGDRFEIRATPAPKYFQGLYVLANGDGVNVQCKRLSKSWVCKDPWNKDDDILISTRQVQNQEIVAEVRRTKSGASSPVLNILNCSQD